MKDVLCVDRYMQFVCLVCRAGVLILSLVLRWRGVGQSLKLGDKGSAREEAHLPRPATSSNDICPSESQEKLSSRRGR